MLLSMTFVSFGIEIGSDMTVYRYAPDKVLRYLRAKATRLSTQQVCDISQTLTRKMARDGLMEDGKENLLERKLSRRPSSVLQKLSLV